MAGPNTRRKTPFEHLIPERTALLVIDMQRYFVRPESPFGKWLQQNNPKGANFHIPAHLVVQRFRATPIASRRQDL